MCIDKSVFGESETANMTHLIKLQIRLPHNINTNKKEQICKQMRYVHISYWITIKDKCVYAIRSQISDIA